VPGVDRRESGRPHGSLLIVPAGWSGRGDVVMYDGDRFPPWSARTSLRRQPSHPPESALLAMQQEFVQAAIVALGGLCDASRWFGCDVYEGGGFADWRCSHCMRSELN
jgi:hypothetical protein